MEFTYEAYENLVNLLKKKDYVFTDYKDYANHDRSVIMRHDVDYSIADSLEMAKVEFKLGIKSTYFVLVSSDFYNVFSKASIQMLREIISMGHTIGLHFDEMAYDENEDIISNILKEKNILEQALGIDNIYTVSMHRPSRRTLDSDYKIPGMINSYGKTFFNDFKYVSDSRRRWREDVEDIIECGKYDRLHILTHAFWYFDTEKGLYDAVSDFINNADKERYTSLKDNISDLDEILKA